MSLAGVRYYPDFDMVAAELVVNRALALNPSHVLGLPHYSWQPGEAGQFEPALQLGKRAIDFDPLSASVRTTIAQAYRSAAWLSTFSNSHRADGLIGNSSEVWS